MQQINEKIVAGLLAPSKGNRVHYFSGATLQGRKAPPGFGIRITASGTKSFVLFHRVDGKKYLQTVGRWDENPQGGSLTVREAIVRADRLAKDINSGRRADPRPNRTRRRQDAALPAGQTVGGMLDSFVERYVRKEAGLRSGDMIATQLERLVKPRVGNLGIYEINRAHVVKMLDQIADQHGARMADLALAYFRKAANWYAIRDDKFTPPIVRGMSRTKPKERARQRVLDDGEIRDLVAALDIVKGVPDCFPRYVRFLFLTATRRSEAADMHSSELTGDVWTIPAERYKTKSAHVLPLSRQALQAIGTIGKGNGFIFSSDKGATPINGWSKCKDKLDVEITKVRIAAGREPMAGWTFHDLRRTARSLMSRAGVPTDHAERALGHVILGVRQTYDRHEYLMEKRAAFEALGLIVQDILRSA